MSSKQEDAVYFYLGSSPQFEHEDKEAAKFGMWLFLYTEMLLFGILILAYSAYRLIYLNDFVEASAHLNKITGTVNTIVLLFSSLTTVLAIVAMQKGEKMLSAAMVIVTILCAFVFLTINI